MCDIHVVDTPTKCDHAKRMALAGMDIGEFVGVCMVSDGQYGASCGPLAQALEVERRSDEGT